MQEIDDRITQFRAHSVRYVVCCRDLSISRMSRQIRFGGKPHEYAMDDQKAREILTYLVRQQDCFIFGYESALALGQAYFEYFAAWVGVPLPGASEIPQMSDANRAYIKKRHAKLLGSEIARRFRIFRHQAQNARRTVSALARRR